MSSLTLLGVFLLVGARAAYAGPLSGALQLRELRTEREARALSPEHQPIAVDINSRIEIEVSTRMLAIASLAANNLSVVQDTQVAHLQAVIGGLETWTKALTDTWQDSVALARMPKDDPRYDALSTKTNAAQSAFFSGPELYEQAIQDLPSGTTRSQELKKNIDDALGLSADEGNPKILKYLADEILWVNGQIRVLSENAVRNGVPMAIKMTAQFSHQDQHTPLHLSGYDSMESGVPEPYDKLRIEPNPRDQEQLAKIDSDAQALATQLNQAKSMQAGLRAVGEQFLNENFAEIKKSVDGLDSAVRALAAVDWTAKKRLLEADHTKLRSSGQSEYAALIASGTAVAKLKADILVRLVKSESDITSLRNQVSLIQSNRQSNKPDLALKLLLGLPAQLEGVFENIRAINNDASLRDELLALEKDLATRMPRLSADIRNELPEWFAALQQPEAARLYMALDSFQNAVKNLESTLAPFSEDVRGRLVAAAGPDLPDIAQARVVPATEAGPTTINILDAHGRDEGDVIQFRALLYKAKIDSQGNATPDGPPVDELTITFELLRYGLYTRPGGGVVFVSRKATPAGANRVKGQAAPSVTWVVQGRRWPSANETRGWFGDFIAMLRPAVGVHAVTLQFDSSGGTELGIGPTVSFFNDLLQGGYGWNLNATGRADYWYAGFRLLHFGKGTGIKQ